MVMKIDPREIMPVRDGTLAADMRHLAGSTRELNASRLY